MIRQSVIPTLIFWALASAIVGCSGKPEVQTAKVSGTIQLDGKPLDGAQVNFLGPDYAGVATTDSSGRYELDAQVAENTVYVLKYEGVGPDFDETMIGTGSDMPGAGPKQSVPPKYSDPVESELRFPVPEAGSSEANFNLTSQ